MKIKTQFDLKGIYIPISNCPFCRHPVERFITSFIDYVNNTRQNQVIIVCANCETILFKIKQWKINFANSNKSTADFEMLKEQRRLK